jgi:hypothetical protein
LLGQKLRLRRIPVLTIVYAENGIQNQVRVVNKMFFFQDRCMR